MIDPRESARSRPPSVVTVEYGSDLFTEVFVLGEQNKATVGMLPGEAWADYALRSRIVAAVAEQPDQEGHRVLGYAAFRLPRDQVSLAHLVVREKYRGTGIAKLLVETLSDRHSQRRGLQAKCRRDYPASRAWPQLGFTAQGDIPGRSNTREPLTVWWRDHGHPDLMSWEGPPPTLTPVIIDANIFIDLHGDELSSNLMTRDILLGTLAGRIELLVSPELGNELNRQKDSVARARLQRIRQSYPVLCVPAGQMAADRDGLIRQLGRRPRGERDLSDLIHVAYAAAAGVAVVVTRDEKASRKLRDAASALFDVSLVGPQELVALLDELESGDDAYAPRALRGTGYALREAGVADQKVLAQFLDVGSGERRTEYNDRLRALAARRGHGATRLLLLAPGGEAVGLLGADVRDGALNVTLLRMRPTALAATLAAQLVSRLRPLATAAGATAMRVTDRHPNALLLESLLADGFGVHENTLVGIAVKASCILEDLSGVMATASAPLTEAEREVIAVLDAANRLHAHSSPNEAAAVERYARPLRVVDAPIDTWLVPIRPAWASQLFNVPPDLIGQTPELGISVEHVYYRKGRSGERAPARVLWYVSAGQKSRRRTHGMRLVGCSELIEVRDDTPTALHRDFRRLGVYSWTEVNAIANRSGTVRALRVINTEIFDREIPLGRLEGLAAEEGQTLSLVSPKRISTRLFARIMQEGLG